MNEQEYNKQNKRIEAEQNRSNADEFWATHNLGHTLERNAIKPIELSTDDIKSHKFYAVRIVGSDTLGSVACSTNIADELSTRFIKTFA